MAKKSKQSNNKIYLGILALIIVILVVVLLLVLLLPQLNQGSAKPPRPSTVDNQTNKPANGIGALPPRPESQTPEIPSGSAALFFTESLSSVKERLGAGVDYANIEGGASSSINWETSTSAVMRYVPQANRVDFMKTGTSSSWSKNAMYPFTTPDGRFFVLRDWGADWTGSTSNYNNQWTLTEIDPMTGVQKEDTGFTTESSFAVVGDKLYFNTPSVRDSFTGQLKSFGKLKVMDLGEGSSYYAKDLIQYSGDTTSGKLYGAGNTLFSVKFDTIDSQNVMSIRTHNLNTGKITTLYDNLIVDDFNMDNIYAGKNALYILTKGADGVYIYRYPTDGDPETLNVVADLLGTNGKVYVAEDNGILGIMEADTKIKTLSLYNLETKEFTDIPIEPFSPEVSFSRVGIPFLVI